ncbi:type II toxin-antitoxin system HicB family antitoxin [Candidatus Desantisbacteria bacterium]|nr:type II toxin-antitoxin system HicB family antitoxin [Candidatus Desantisbacteria bacterium]
MDFYTIVLRKSNDYWVSLCLENGLVGQGETKKEATEKLREAVDSFESIRIMENNIYTAPVAIKELHEFLTIEDMPLIIEQQLEMRAMYA